MHFLLSRKDSTANQIYGVRRAAVMNSSSLFSTSCIWLRL